MLVVVQTGWPPEAGKAVFDCLMTLHTHLPLDWIFCVCDPRNSELTLLQEEIRLERFLSVMGQYAEAHKESLTFLRNTSLASPAFEFAAQAQPPVRFRPLDDWWGWALSREAVWFVDLEAAKLRLALGLLSSDAAISDAVADFGRVVQLEWAYKEYRAHLASAERVVSHLRGSAAARVPRSLCDFLLTAWASGIDFYEGMRMRVEALVQGALETVQRNRAQRAAILVDIHFLHVAEQWLQERRLRWQTVVPDGVYVTSGMDFAVHFLNEAENARRAQRIFAPEQASVHTDSDLLAINKRSEVLKKRARDWVAAAHGYAAQYESTRDCGVAQKMRDCLTRACGCVPDYPDALWLLGELRMLENDASGALALFERALQNDSHSAEYWRAKGSALRELERWKEAYRSFIRAIYLMPRSGKVWSTLGYSLYLRRQKRAACYCFAKGKAYGDAAASKNLSTVCERRPTVWDAPIAVHPCVVFVMHRLFRREARRDRGTPITLPPRDG